MIVSPPPATGTETARSGPDALRPPARIASATESPGVGDDLSVEERELVSSARVVTAIARVEAAIAARVGVRFEPEDDPKQNGGDRGGRKDGSPHEDHPDSTDEAESSRAGGTDAAAPQPVASFSDAPSPAAPSPAALRVALVAYGHAPGSAARSPAPPTRRPSGEG